MANKATLKRKAHRQRQKAQRGAVSDNTTHPGGQSVNIPRPNLSQLGPLGVAQSLRRTLPWAVVPTYSTTPAGTFLELDQIIMNSPYDPDASLGGLSASGFAKYMAFYSKCFCMGARVKVYIANCGVGGVITPTSVGLFGLTINTNTAVIGAAVTAIETGFCDYGLLSNSPSQRTLTLGVDIGKFLDKPDVLDDPQLFCTASANPSQLIVAHLWMSNYGVATTLSSAWSAEVEFDCVFTDPIPFN